MKRIVVIIALLIGLKIQAQSVRINAASFSNAYLIINDQKMRSDQAGVMVNSHQQNLSNSISTNVSELNKDGENNTTLNIVVQEELVAGRVGSGYTQIQDFVNKIKYRIRGWNLKGFGK